MDTSQIRVLVTGVSGYLASTIFADLFKKGYTIRGTTRSLANTTRLQYIEELKKENPGGASRIELVEGNLLQEDQWASIVQDCKYVIHTASPMTYVADDVERDIIKPAKEGTLNVLKAAASKGVKKVVITSSVSAVYETGVEPREYTEEDWTDVEKHCAHYPRSKTLAERSAWCFAKEHPELEVTVVNPSFIIGPTLVTGSFTSAQLVGGILTGKMPSMLDVKIGVADVRDISTTHIALMEAEGTANERYICSGHNVWIKDISDVLVPKFADKGYSVTTDVIGRDVIEKSTDPRMTRWINVVGVDKRLNSDKLKAKIGIEYMSLEKSLVEMADSLIERGLDKFTDAPFFSD
mmetsp:Transcript_65491/g.75329  ORF Transcript_65491/g.75329 Transcript_65491/m.75329 type:complete len:351 (-) Transcript_65491:128-1180(-)